MTTATVQVFRTDDAPDGLLERLRPMLNEIFVRRFDDDDWQHALGGWHAVVLGDDGESIVAHAAVVERRIDVDEHPFRTGYVEAVATDPASQGTGAGSAVMRAINDVIAREFEFGALATGSHHFYERLGWQRWQGPSYVCLHGDIERTADEDAGLMVLRTGPSAAVDINAPILSHFRRGAVW